MNLTGKHEGGNSNAITDSTGDVALRLGERTNQNELGKLLEADDPVEAMDKEYHRLTKEGHSLWATSAYLDVGPAAGGTAGDSRVQTQEFNDNARSTGSPKAIREALELALKEYQLMSREDLQILLNLLQTDELMKPIE